MWKFSLFSYLILFFTNSYVTFALLIPPLSFVHATLHANMPLYTPLYAPLTRHFTLHFSHHFTRHFSHHFYATNFAIFRPSYELYGVIISEKAIEMC